jgi:hypothetical protein
MGHANRPKQEYAGFNTTFTQNKAGCIPLCASLAALSYACSRKNISNTTNTSTRSTAAQPQTFVVVVVALWLELKWLWAVVGCGLGRARCCVRRGCVVVEK